MKTKEEIEQLAFLKYPRLINDNPLCRNPNNPMEDDNTYERKIWIGAYTQCQEDMADKKYTEEDMLNASKYGYEFRDTTSFPKHKFEDSCINNTKQWIYSLNKQD